MKGGSSKEKVWQRDRKPGRLAGDESVPGLGRKASTMHRKGIQGSKENLQKRKHHGKRIALASCQQLAYEAEAPDSNAQRGPFLELTENLLACVL